MDGLRYLQLTLQSDNWNVKIKTHPEEFNFEVVDWNGGYKIQKPFDFKPGKYYIIACSFKTIVWSEIKNYE